DESFAGYRRYRRHLYEERVRSLLPQWLRGPLFGLAGAVYPKADWAPKVLRAKSTFQALAKDRLEGYLDSLSIAHEGVRRAMFSKALRRELDGYSAVDVLREHGAEAPRDDPIARAQYIDLKTYLAGDILTKVDRASMAHSLEVRVPILDHTFVEWAAGLSTSLKFKNGSGKYILKRALEEWLPGDVLYRPKMGFAVP